MLNKKPTGLSPKLRPKGTNLLNAGEGKSSLPMHERIYKTVMELGTDDVKEQYRPVLAELMLEVDDILDK